jgi:type I restriction enzyme M protein
MITGDIKSMIDAVWNAFWSGGISNPLEVIGQITYLRREFARRLWAVEKLRVTSRGAQASLETLFSSLQHQAFGGDTDAKRRAVS